MAGIEIPLKVNDISEDVIDSRDAAEEDSYNTLHEIPTGIAYKLTNISIQEPKLDEEARITTIESWENNMYIGTSRGQIVHYYKIDDSQGYIQISKQWIHQSKRNSIRKIIILSEIGKVCVLYGHQLTCLSLPELSPANIGKVKDINDMGFDWADLVIHDKKMENKLIKRYRFNDEAFCQLIAFTSSSIRILRIFKDSIRLHKEIPFDGGIKRGVQNGSFVPIARGEANQYDLIDIEDSKRIPLFPIFSKDDGQLLNVEPQMAVLNNEEFLLVSGGRDIEDQCMGMCINTKGDITRTTLSWDEYPRDLIIDFPYVISTSVNEKKNTIYIHSLHEQREVTQIQVSFDVNISQVFKIFKIKDSSMVEKSTLGPFISQMDNDDIERITVEFDKANKINLIETSILIYDDFGKNFKLLQPISKIDRWLNTYKQCNNRESQFVFDKLMDELRGSKSGDKFLISLLGLFCLKFGLTNQLFEIWYGNYKVIDPRILIYVIENGEIEFKSSVWTFNGLFDLIEDLKSELVLTNELEEFYKLYLSSCLSLTFKKDHEDIMRSIEISYLKKNLNSLDVLIEFVDIVKYSKTETIEVLLLNKKYWMLCCLYKKFGYHSQYLYYLKGLIQGKFEDDWFKETSENALMMLKNYIVDECLDDFELIWKYIEWILKDYPEIGLEMVMNPKLTHIGMNEIQVLKLLQTDKQQCEYLQFLYEVNGEFQFLGDLTISIIRNLMYLVKKNEGGLLEKLQGVKERYQRLPIPRISFEEYWQGFGIKDQSEFNKYHSMGLKYLEMITNDTVSIIIDGGGEGLDDDKKCVIAVRKLIGGFESMIPLISVRVLDQGEIVDILCEIGDYDSAENAARVQQDLLGVLFERYLALGRGQLLDRFLVKYGGEVSGDALDGMGGFLQLLGRVPDETGAVAVRGFLLSGLRACEDFTGKSAANISLRRSLLSGRKNWVI